MQELKKETVRGSDINIKKIANEQWLQYINQTQRRTWYLINGVAYDSIIPTRGLCQGDPISPYIFLLCADGFSSLINDANQRIS